MLGLPRASKSDFRRTKAESRDGVGSFKVLHPDHPVFQFYKASGKLKFCIPWMKHGDEGKSRAKQNVAMFNLQPVFYMLAHSLVSRYLYTNMPEELYAILRKQSVRASEGNRVLDELLTYLAEDLTDLFHNGSHHSH